MQVPLCHENTNSSNINTYHMITSAKARIAMPKSYTVALAEFNVKESTYAKQALLNPLWKNSIQVEFKAFINNKTLPLVATSKNKIIIGNKWLFRACLNQKGLQTTKSYLWSQTSS